MSFFDEIFAKIFGKEKSASSPVVIDGLIKRTQGFIDEYEQWKGSTACKDLLSEVSKSYFLSKERIENDPEVILHAGSNSYGFALTFSSRFEKTSFHYFFDYLAEQVKKLDYKVSVSKQTLKEHGEEVVKKEMHYLKPKNQFVKPIDQKYGNVQIEYIEHNNEPSRIKFVANSYPDRNYTEALSFESLAEIIFEFEPKS